MYRYYLLDLHPLKAGENKLFWYLHFDINLKAFSGLFVIIAVIINSIIIIIIFTLAYVCVSVRQTDHRVVQ
jgi:hypothetical protein